MECFVLYYYTSLLYKVTNNIVLGGDNLIQYVLQNTLKKLSTDDAKKYFSDYKYIYSYDFFNWLSLQQEQGILVSNIMLDENKSLETVFKSHGGSYIDDGCIIVSSDLERNPMGYVFEVLGTRDI